MFDNAPYSFFCWRAVPPPIARATEPPKSVKVFILAGQSNMEGQAVVDLDGKDYKGKGTLAALFKDPAKAKVLKHLKGDNDKWAVCDDVWVRYQREEQPLLAGPLTRGFSVHLGATSAQVLMPAFAPGGGAPVPGAGRSSR